MDQELHTIKGCKGPRTPSITNDTNLDFVLVENTLRFIVLSLTLGNVKKCKKMQT